MKGLNSYRSKKLVMVVALALAAGGFLGSWASGASGHAVGAFPAVTFSVAPDRSP